MNKSFGITAVLLIVSFYTVEVKAQQLYELPADAEARWVSFENRSGDKGRGAMENKGGKGHPSEWINAGQSVTLLDFDGAGIINRIWMTIIDRNSEALRAIHIEMYWDKATKPAVSAPLGDFFGVGLGRMAAFQSALFTNPEGKSFNCYIPMPFKTHARIVLINESKQNQLLFYDVDLTKVKKHLKNIAYFHAYWSNNKGVELGQDFEILPRVNGKGRYLGANIGVIADKIYGDTWFGEGEVKTYLDGDNEYPTLAGTGTEDYIGSAWNLGPFSQLYQGATVVDKQKKQFAFYRYHIPDPIYFHTDCRVTIQQIGGAGRDLIRAIVKAGGKAKPISVGTSRSLIKLLDDPAYPDLFDDKFPADEWVNFYRVDNYSATAYFYLDKPESNLPQLAPLVERIKGV